MYELGPIMGFKGILPEKNVILRKNPGKQAIMYMCMSKHSKMFQVVLNCSL